MKRAPIVEEPCLNFIQDKPLLNYRLLTKLPYNLLLYFFYRKLLWIGRYHQHYTLEHQLNEIEMDIIFEEKVSGATKDREQLQKM